jgi:phosphate transport system substrate-binding protein
MRRTQRALAIAAFTALVSCSTPALPGSTPTTTAVTLRLYAVTATAPLVADLTTAYSQLNPAVRFETVSGDYQAMVDRLRRGEMPYFVSNHLPIDSVLWGAPIGQDGIAIVTHLQVGVRGLSLAQLRDIYQGEITRWCDVAGADLPIAVITREDGSGTRAEFERLVMGDRRTTPNAEIVPTSKAMMTRVAQLPGSIGYVSMSHLDATVRALEVEGIAPTPENVAKNIYPLRSTLYVVGLVEPDSDFRAFIGWVQSPAGQAIVARHNAPVLVTTP